MMIFLFLLSLGMNEAATIQPIISPEGSVLAWSLVPAVKQTPRKHLLGAAPGQALHMKWLKVHFRRLPNKSQFQLPLWSKSSRWGVHKLSVHVFSHVELFVIPWTTVCPAPLPMRFPRQEHWRNCHFLLQGIFPIQGLDSHLLCLMNWQTGSLPAVPPWECVFHRKT